MSELRLKQEVFALAQAGIGFVLVALVLLGIGGTIYKVIAPDGWVAQAFGRSLSAGARNSPTLRSTGSRRPACSTSCSSGFEAASDALTGPQPPLPSPLGPRCPPISRALFFACKKFDET